MLATSRSYLTMFYSDAIFSGDRIYRYALSRWWDEKKPAVMIIGLNPSTADENTNDPTIRRCIGFANRWGFGKLFVCNLFAYKATNPKDLFAYHEPIGNENDQMIMKISKEVQRVVLAYGNLGTFLNRHKKILSLVENPHYINISKRNLPMHPLYLKYTDQPIKYKRATRSLGCGIRNMSGENT